ncbi:MAG TPA: hypothetical protein VNT52_06650 [Acidimicrobiales bacterium]|nr:hypothetical protein [Acidimicrobiales bacterium]
MAPEGQLGGLIVDDDEVPGLARPTLGAAWSAPSTRRSASGSTASSVKLAAHVSAWWRVSSQAKAAVPWWVWGRRPAGRRLKPCQEC